MSLFLTDELAVIGVCRTKLTIIFLTIVEDHLKGIARGIPHGIMLKDPAENENVAVKQSIFHVLKFSFEILGENSVKHSKKILVIMECCAGLHQADCTMANQKTSKKPTFLKRDFGTLALMCWIHSKGFGEKFTFSLSEVRRLSHLCPFSEPTW